MTDKPLRCHSCGSEQHRPQLWFPSTGVHRFSQSIVIMTHHLC